MTNTTALKLALAGALAGHALVQPVQAQSDCPGGWVWVARGCANSCEGAYRVFWEQFYCPTVPGNLETLGGCVCSGS